MLIKAFQDNAAEVVVRRCLDLSGGRFVQEVVVRRFENRVWEVGPFTTTSETC